MINPQPYFTRYNVLLLAGVALLWGGTQLFARGRRRWLLAGMVAVNLSALVGVVAINVYLHKTTWSQPGGKYFYVSDEDRATMAGSLAGRPLLVITESSLAVSSMDALLPGPEAAFPLQYVMCPADGDWSRDLQFAANRSNWLALIHNGRATINPGPEFARPGAPRCPDMPTRDLAAELAGAGWTPYRQNAYVDLWSHP